jgi:hypothetical protein
LFLWRLVVYESAERHVFHCLSFGSQLPGCQMRTCGGLAIVVLPGLLSSLLVSGICKDTTYSFSLTLQH